MVWAQYSYLNFIFIYFLSLCYKYSIKDLSFSLAQMLSLVASEKPVC